MLWQILSLLVIFFATRFVWRRWKYDLHKVPSPPGLPLLGHTLEFVYGHPSHQVSQWVGSCLKQLGNPRLMRADVMGSSWLFVTDIDFLKNVMLSTKASFPRMSFSNDIVEALIGRSATAKSISKVSMPTPYVKAVRKVYTTASQTSNLRLAMPRLSQVMEKMINVIEDERSEGPIDVQSLFVRMTLDAIGATAFDSNFGGLDGSRDLYRMMLQGGYIFRDRLNNPLKSLYVKYFPKSKEAQRQNSVVDALTAHWKRLTEEFLSRDDPPNGEEPLWHVLINLTDPETNKPIAYQSLVSEVAGVVIGGMDSTGHQLGWLFGLLASHPQIVQKLLEELAQRGLYGTGARDVTFEDLAELSYLTAVIKEGMRIGYVLTLSFLRLVPKDMIICGYRIPKNTVIIAPGTRAMDTEAEWGDPEIFRPERWLTDEDLSRNYYYGFGFGPRDCPGQKLSMLEMRLAIIKLITRYQITLKGTKEDLLSRAKDGFVIEVRDGVWINFTPRTTR